MAKSKRKGGFAQFFKVGLMGLATMMGGAVPGSIATNSAPASAQVQQTAQDQKQAPITNPIPIHARKQTDIGTPIYRGKRARLLGSIPQKHAKHRVNRIHASRKAKRRHRRS